MTKPLGGFFGLDIFSVGNGYHTDAYALSNGRTCFKVVLMQTRPSLVYVPFYTCDALLEPLKELSIEYKYYSIDQNFEPETLPELGERELFVYINYFGLKPDVVEKLLNIYKDKLVIDNTQAFFESGYLHAWSFNSARKFFGVPDGGYLYAPAIPELDFPRNTSFITEHLCLKVDGKLEDAYKAYQYNESLQNCELRKMSLFSESILGHIPYDMVIKARRANYAMYDELLKEYNTLQFNLDSAVPFGYLFLPEKKLEHKLFHVNKIFVPVLWPDILKRAYSEFAAELHLSENLLILPLDHRVNEVDINNVVKFIKSIL